MLTDSAKALPTAENRVQQVVWVSLWAMCFLSLAWIVWASSSAANALAHFTPAATAIAVVSSIVFIVCMSLWTVRFCDISGGKSCPTYSIDFRCDSLQMFRAHTLRVPTQVVYNMLWRYLAVGQFITKTMRLALLPSLAVACARGHKNTIPPLVFGSLPFPAPLRYDNLSPKAGKKTLAILVKSI